jgi:hypothetical protein
MEQTLPSASWYKFLKCRKVGCFAAFPIFNCQKFSLKSKARIRTVSSKKQTFFYQHFNKQNLIELKARIKTVAKVKK